MPKISNPRQLAIYDLLARDGTVAAVDIATTLGTSYNAILGCLKRMKQNGLVRVVGHTRRARWALVDGAERPTQSKVGRNPNSLMALRTYGGTGPRETWPHPPAPWLERYWPAQR